MGSVEAQLATMAAEIRALRERGDERHDSNVDLFREMQADIKEISVGVKDTNGKVADAHREIAANNVRLAKAEADVTRLFSTATGVVKVADLKVYVVWGLGCASAGIGAVLWVLKVVGKI